MGMGYQGFIRMYKQGPAVDPMLLLATGSSVNLQLEPIYSSAVWGAGWYNAADSAHYADNAVRYEGSIDTELQIGAGGDIWTFIANWVIAERAYGRSFDISPDGARVYQYRTSDAYGANYDLFGAWNTSAGFSTSQDSFVTASLGMVALYRDEVDPAGGSAYDQYTYIRQKLGVVGSDCAVFNTTNPLNPNGNNADPIPFWRTNAQLLTGNWQQPFSGGEVPQAGMETVEWNIDVSQNQVILYTCNGNRLPTAVLMGAMSVNGGVTLYHPDGIFDPILGPDGTGQLDDPALFAANTWFRVEISSGPTDRVYIELPATVIESDDYGLRGQNDVTNRVFNLKGMGGRCYNNIAQPPCLMSDGTGAFIDPASP